MSDDNNPYYRNAEEQREAITLILDCTKYWPSPREHMVFKGLLAEVARLRADLAQRTAERDEARREVCEMRARSMKGPMEVAADRGWDCFDAKEAKP